MVKKFCLLLFLFLTSFLGASPLQIEVHIDSKLASENEPLIGKIMVLHSEKEQVDEKSFTLEDQPLKVQLLSQGKQTSLTIINGKRSEERNCISCYTFQIPGQKKGQHKLAPIHFKVGDKWHKSSPSLYEVIAAETHDDFVLEGVIDAPKKIYPGQRFKVSYRLYLKTDIEPTLEHLPLLNPKGCLKIGERQMKQMRRGHLQIIEFTQLLEAKDVGEVEIEPGYVEGFAYQEDFFLRKVYKKPKLRAQTQPLAFTIEPFPQNFHFESFSGAIGNFSMDVALLSSPKVCLGDKLKLQFTFKGSDLDTLKLPNFAFQKPFKDTFRFSDLPTLGKSEKGQKEFIVEMRPMDPNLQEIPPFEFSFFDPESNSYRVLKSQALPLEVTALEKPSIALSSLEDKPQKKNEERSFDLQKAQAKTPPPIDIAGLLKLNPTKDIRKEKVLLWPWFFCLTLLFAQFLLKKKLWIKKKAKSEKIFSEAKKYAKEPQKYSLLVEKAFSTRLMEEGWLQKGETIDTLSNEGLNGQIKHFFEHLHHELFAQNARFDFEKSLSHAQALFKRIGEER